MTIGIIGAMQMEIDNLKESLIDSRTEVFSSVEFVSGKLGDKNIVAAKSGVGKVNAAISAQTMIHKYNVDMLINIGVAGTLTRDLSVLDVALAKNVVQHDMDTSPMGDPVGLISGPDVIFIEADAHMNDVMADCLKERGIKFKKGTIATGDQFIAREEQKDYITDHFEAIAAEMEGGSIGHVCYVNHVPFAILRSISDGDGGIIDYETFAEKAAVQSIEVVVDFINRI